MPVRLQSLASELSKLNGQIKHAMEQAEAKAEKLNLVLAELAQSRVLAHTVLLGKYRELPYDPDAGPDHGGRVIQAALLVPEGFGVCEWQSEEAYQIDQEPKHFQRDARERFRPFGELDEADKMFVLPQVEALLEELMAIAQGVPAVAAS